MLYAYFCQNLLYVIYCSWFGKKPLGDKPYFCIIEEKPYTIILVYGEETVIQFKLGDEPLIHLQLIKNTF